MCPKWDTWRDRAAFLFGIKRGTCGNQIHRWLADVSRSVASWHGTSSCIRGQHPQGDGRRTGEASRGSPAPRTQTPQAKKAALVALFLAFLINAIVTGARESGIIGNFSYILGELYLDKVTPHADMLGGVFEHIFVPNPAIRNVLLGFSCRSIEKDITGNLSRGLWGKESRSLLFIHDNLPAAIVVGEVELGWKWIRSPVGVKSGFSRYGGSAVSKLEHQHEAANLRRISGIVLRNRFVTFQVKKRSLNRSQGFPIALVRLERQTRLPDHNDGVNGDKASRYFRPHQLLIVGGFILFALGGVLFLKFWHYVDLRTGFNENMAVGIFFAAISALAVGGLMILHGIGEI
jgi:hypothetical protein